MLYTYKVNQKMFPSLLIYPVEDQRNQHYVAATCNGANVSLRRRGNFERIALYLHIVRFYTFFPSECADKL